MKKILLIGDSIRKGYDAYVRERMANLANVYFPEENCTFTTNILRFLHVWTDNLKLYEADAVHFNAGLWDTLRIYGDDVLVKPDTYADNLKRIASRIRFLFPNAKILFATSTPVCEEGYFTDFESRTNENVRLYNRIARDVFAGTDVVINDLYTLAAGFPESWRSDQTHFYTGEATEKLGNRVCDALCDALMLDKGKLLQPELAPYHYPDRFPGDKEVYVKKGHIYVTR